VRIDINEGQILALFFGEAFVGWSGGTSLIFDSSVDFVWASNEEAEMNVRYRVELSQAERDELTAMLSGGKHAARKLKRAQNPVGCRRWQRR